MSTWLLLACGVWLVLLGLYFIVLRPPLLPEDTRFMGSSLAQVRAALPGLEPWLQRVFTVLGGFTAGAGVLIVFAARVEEATHRRARLAAVATAGVLTVGLMSAVNFDLHSDFKGLLLIPALVWFAGFALLLTRR